MRFNAIVFVVMTQLREEFNRGGEITLTVETGVHDVATLLKEFFRDLPEPIVPKDLQPALLAIHSKPLYFVLFAAGLKCLCFMRSRCSSMLTNSNTQHNQQ